MQKFLFVSCFAILALLSNCSDSANQASVAAKPSPVKKQVKKAASPSTAPAKGAIQVDISNIEVQQDEEACVSFNVSDFDNIMAFQHSIKFDPAQLEYKSTKNYGLPNLNEGNFGATKAKEGSINFLWFDMNVKGVSLADKSKVFDLCFQVKAKKGAYCEVLISDKPLAMEVVGPQKQRMKLNASKGVITVK